MDFSIKDIHKKFLQLGHKPGPFSYSEKKRDNIWNELLSVTYTSTCKACNQSLEYTFKPLRNTDLHSADRYVSINFRAQSMLISNWFLEFKWNKLTKIDKLEDRLDDQAGYCPRVASML
jgi:hypothetical protein